jgi:hypothetical protein
MYQRTQKNQQKKSASQGKKRGCCCSKKKKEGAAAPKLKKTKEQKDFHLKADKKKQDPLLLRSVAFDLDDDGYGSQLVQHFGGLEVLSKSITWINIRRILFGTIINLLPHKKGVKTVLYEVEWEDSTLQSTPIELPALNEARILADELEEMRTATTRRLKQTGGETGNKNPFSTEMLKMLTVVEDEEDGIPLDSDAEADDDDENDDEGIQIPSARVQEDGLTDALLAHPFLVKNNNSENLYVEDMPESNDDDDIRFFWSTRGTLAPPADLADLPETHVKEEHVSKFSTPLKSFLAFVPVRMFYAITLFSNDYAHHLLSDDTNENKLIGGRTWKHDIKMNEMMKFFGILFQMTLRPTPGLSFPECWKDAAWHPYTKFMTLWRFKQIRTVLHFNSNTNFAESRDAVHKVRPLLNCLKLTFPTYIEVGNELALDEASIACRSKYGADVVFFNPKKPSGKFHFRLYLLCCSETYACIRLRMHTRNQSDLADGQNMNPTEPEKKTKRSGGGTKTTGMTEEEIEAANETNEDIENVDDDVEKEGGKSKDKKKEEEKNEKIVSLCKDMCSSLFQSGRVVNMDNYYTSPLAAVELAKNKVYIRGTICTNRVGFPKGVLFTKMEAKNQGRGTFFSVGTTWFQEVLHQDCHGLTRYGSNKCMDSLQNPESYAGIYKNSQVRFHQ